MKKIGGIGPLQPRPGLSISNRRTPQISAAARKQIRKIDEAKARIPHDRLIGY